MSDDDRDNPIESDADKRAHNNALKKLLDQLGDCFISLRDSLPAFQGNIVHKATPTQILEEAFDYIQWMLEENSVLQQEKDELKMQKRILEDQHRSLEEAKATGNFAAIAEEIRISSSKAGAVSDFDVDSEDSSENSYGSED